ncbi:GNAT family N-acetyltransferase [Cellulomonas bogoriensis]|uniref:GCN5 family acetyltransferase n=1 Tax=Cellulomonas bogoriensis 69B4 = DSM 16987 TaxID=1386082 RepID=A0A0A0C0M7_9CELL|nr:GNAT family N-acetyltransferase [Cellulomonas bogoriensis]KGM12984.1 GCN5 family acetyltransferase [Cellulomonas bogoriensis 69B4 = DSM 16987]
MVDEPTGVVIRSATPQDARAIADVHVTSWRQAYAGLIDEEYLAGLDVDTRAERWRDTLEGNNSTQVWVAQDDDHVVGFASLGPSQDEDAGRETMQVYALYLDPAAWGRGAARSLIRMVIDAVPTGAPLTLWVAAGNDRARHFYRRNGFVDDGVERIEEFGGDRVREVRYRRS